MKEAILRDGPFAGDKGNIEGKPPEHLRCWFTREDVVLERPDGTRYRARAGEVIWVPEADSDWPNDAARYALVEVSEDPILYVFDGVGDGFPSLEDEREARTEDKMVVVHVGDGNRVTVEVGSA